MNLIKEFSILLRPKRWLFWLIMGGFGLGAGTVLSAGGIDPLKAILVFLGVTVLTTSGHAIDDYMDFVGGKSKLLEDYSESKRKVTTKSSGLIEPTRVLYWFVFLALLSLLIALVLFVKYSLTWILLLAGLAIVAQFLYPLISGYPLVGEFFGATSAASITLAAYYVAKQSIDLIGIQLWLVSSLYLGIVFFVHHFADEEEDKKLGIKTTVVVLGKEKLIKFLQIYTILFAILIALIAYIGFLPKAVLIASLLLIGVSFSYLLLKKFSLKRHEQVMQILLLGYVAISVVFILAFIF